MRLPRSRFTRRPSLIGRRVGLVVVLAVLAGGGPGQPASSAPISTAATPEDLGTAGHSSSAVAINENGQVAGNELVDEHAQAFLWTREGGREPIVFPPGISTKAVALNDNGQVAGDTYFLPNELDGFSWTRDGGFKNIDPSADYEHTEALAVSGNGRVAGYGWNNGPNGGSFNAITWTESGGTVEFGRPSRQSRAVDVNDAGTAVGFFEYGANQACKDGNMLAMVWGQDGSETQLGLEPCDTGTQSAATGINASGQVAGWSSTDDGRGRAFSWTAAGGIIDLGAPRTRSEARGLNDRGQVIGCGDRPGDFVWHPFIWSKEDGMRDLGSLGGYDACATAVNENGEVVGYSYLPDLAKHAFLWTEAGGMTDLGTLGGTNSEATDINDKGQIVGWSDITGDTESHAVLWDYPIEVRALEVSQAVQTWHNSVPLVENKATSVRAFVQTEAGRPDTEVVGRLYGTRDGAPLPESPLTSLNAGDSIMATQDIVSRRGILSDSLNFDLPASWLSGTVTLRFVANEGAAACAEPTGPGTDPAGDCTVTVTFTRQTPPSIVYVRIPWESGGTTLLPTGVETVEQMLRTKSMFPTNYVEYEFDDLASSFPSEPDLFLVAEVLALKRIFETSASCSLAATCHPSEYRYYGVLAGQPKLYRAEGAQAGPVASGYLHGVGGEDDTGFGRATGPHEQGHIAGLEHAVDLARGLTKEGYTQGQCGELAAGAAPGYTPFEIVGGKRRPVLGPLSAGADEEVWGLDHRFLSTDTNGLAVVDPRQTFELMSYCAGGVQDLWPSKSTYEALMSAFPTSGHVAGATRAAGASASDTAPTASVSGDFVVVRGTVEFLADRATLQPATTVSGALEVPIGGSYRAQLLDGDGHELAGVDFEPNEMDGRSATGGGPALTGLVAVPVPKPAAAVARIAILHFGVEIGGWTASAHPPTVSIVHPAAGQTLATPQVTLNWTAADADGGTLWSNVLYSADAGHSWNALAIDSEETSLTVARGALTASTDARLRVIVSDGVNTATADSEPFAVANNAPTVVILDPRPGRVFSGDQAIVLNGFAHDREQGALDDAIEWSSDVAGPLGHGASIQLVARDLAEGRHVITATVRDGAISASDTVTITIHRETPADGEAPVLTVPSDLTAEATDPGGATVEFTATATDDTDPSPAVACEPSSGSLFPLGETTVDCEATDAAGNTANASFKVTVVDTTAPVVTVPANVAAEATGPTGRAVDFTTTAHDAVAGDLAPACTPASGSTFPLGATTVTCEATDAHGNTGHASFKVTVEDTTASAVTVPADVTAEATGPAGRTVVFTAGAHDAVDGDLAPTCAPASGSTFPLGETTVTCEATDTHGNTGHASFKVTIVDTAAPVVTVPADITAQATGPAGHTIDFTAGAHDAVDGDLAPTCAPASGSTFPLGETTVACEATDAHGNTGHASFKVTVTASSSDTTPPVLTLPGSITTDATGPGGALVGFFASALDAVDGTRPVTCTPPSLTLFAIGDTTVSCSASDTRGNTSHGAFTVHVRGAGEQLAALQEAVEAADPPLKKGLAKDLQKRLEEAAKELTKGKSKQACHKLDEFADKVAAAKKKHKRGLAIATDSIRRAEQIRDVLGC